jgi:hypothetical protein
MMESQQPKMASDIIFLASTMKRKAVKVTERQEVLVTLTLSVSGGLSITMQHQELDLYTGRTTDM